MLRLKKINIAIVGCGKIAEKHALILTSKKIKQFNLVAVCDVDKKKAKKFADKFNINVFFNIDNLLKTTNIDLVVICTPSGYHYENALAISKYKKNIII
jgi:predicted dehydrogenase